MKNIFVLFALLFTLLLVVGCGLKMANSKIGLEQTVVVNNYDSLRKIVIEEATNNGFSNLTEVKPSKYNNWEGRINFINNNDIFKAEILKDGDKYLLYMHGGTTSANLDGAIQAITQRVNELNKLPAPNTKTVATTTSKKQPKKKSTQKKQ